MDFIDLNDRLANMEPNKRFVEQSTRSSYKCSTNLDKMKEIFEKETIDIHYDNNRAFKNSLDKRDIKLCEWFLTLDSLESFDIHYNNNQALKSAVSARDYEFCKWLIELDSVESFDIHYDNDFMLRAFSYNRYRSYNIHVDWVLSLDSDDSFDIHYGNDLLFRNICKCTHKESSNDTFVTMLLRKYPDINIHANNDEGLKDICSFGRHVALDYLLSNYTFSSDLINECFRYVCESMCPNKFDLMVKTGQINKDNYKNQLLGVCLSHNSNKITIIGKFLELNIDYDINHIIRRTLKHGHIHTVNFLLRNSNNVDIDFNLLVMKTSQEISRYKHLNNDDLKNNFVCLLDKNIKKLSELNKESMMMLKRNGLLSRYSYIYINSKFLSKDERTMKTKITKAVEIISRFLHKKYFEPGGIFFNRQLAKI